MVKYVLVLKLFVNISKLYIVYPQTLKMNKYSILTQ